MEQRFFVVAIHDAFSDFDEKHPDPSFNNMDSFYVNLCFSTHDSFLRQLYDISDLYDVMTVFNDDGRLVFYKHDEICFCFGRETELSNTFYSVGDPNDYMIPLRFFTTLSDEED